MRKAQPQNENIRTNPCYSPDEYPFTPIAELPPPILKPVLYPQILYPNKVNANPSILSFYTRAIVPRITRQATLALATLKRANGITGDEEHEDTANYGSAATLDLEVLQAVSKRVHYGVFRFQSVPPSNRVLTSTLLTGKFVAESKFIEHPEAFIPHILTPNRNALEALITKPEVERKLLLRLRKKALVYAQGFAPDGEPLGDAVKIEIDSVVELYESYIIPLTREVEVRTLLSVWRPQTNCSAG